jgi:hypothetical protein
MNRQDPRGTSERKQTDTPHIQSQQTSPSHALRRMFRRAAAYLVALPLPALRRLRRLQLPSYKLG